jgi:hypothetical protein
MRTFDDLTLLVDDGRRPLPEAVMEVLLAVGPRLQRHLPHPMRNHVLALVKMNLGILLVATEDDLVALERGAALIGEGFPAMLRESFAVDVSLSAPICFKGITERFEALRKLRREAEAVAWMRECVPRFEAVGVRGQVGWLYIQWARLYSMTSDAFLWVDLNSQKLLRSYKKLLPASKPFLRSTSYTCQKRWRILSFNLAAPCCEAGRLLRLRTTFASAK